MFGAHDGTGWWMVFGGMGMIIFWAFVIWLVVWGVPRFSTGSENRGEQIPSPADIVKVRLARREIKVDEYEDLMRTLR